MRTMPVSRFLLALWFNSDKHRIGPGIPFGYLGKDC